MSRSVFVTRSGSCETSANASGRRKTYGFRYKAVVLLTFIPLIVVLTTPLHAEVSGLAMHVGAVQYTVSEPTDVTIELRNASEKLVAVLFAGYQLPGQYRFSLAEAASTQKISRGRYVIHVLAGRRAQLDPTFGEQGYVQLGNPSDIVIGADGNLFVLEHKRAGDGKSGVCKLTPDGGVGSGFGPIGDFVELPLNGDWLAIDGKGRLFAPCIRGIVQVLGLDGKALFTINGNGPTGGVIGPNQKFYLRTGYDKGMQVFDVSKPDRADLLLNLENPKDGPVLFRLAPLIGLYIGPSMAVGRDGRLYMTDGQDPVSSRGTIARLQDTGDGIERRYFYQRCLKDCIGLALDNRGMIYVTERGTCSTERDDGIWQRVGRGGITPSTLYQLWDNDEQFNLVTKWELPEVKGLRDVAVVADGSCVYLLEDGINFAIFRGEKKFDTRDVQGLGRLWRYKLGYQQSLTLPVEVK